MSTVEVLEGIDAGLVWHHGQPVAEQRALEAGTGVVDWSPAPGVGRGVFTVTGPDRLTWLHSLTTQHLERQADGEPFTALLLSPTGHIEHVLHGVDHAADETVWAWTEPGQLESLVGWLDRMRFMTRVEVADRSADFRLMQVGRELRVVPRSEALPDGTPAGTWAAEALRIAAGQPRIGLDTDHKTIPNEIGLLGTHLDKGCYRGQETVARVHTLGRPPRRLVQLLLDGSVDALPALGSSATLPGEDGQPGREVGVVGSSARHHELGPVALALVKRNVPVEQTLLADGIAASQEALVDPEVGLHVRPLR
ncbi:YgfZ/GcvT domain-containing protein [Aestuariimicrobium soli]|uniref:CAF17-like 4Fe-4S cluster assembly/insertion protein YgfZ n=1 Tax=Aestuariimicrobium soli TaxID=2035834 RepID=UPI003EB98026